MVNHMSHPDTISSARACKICGEAATPAHTVKDIVYYHCPRCNFLQNFHWEDTPTALQKQQVAANDEARERLWPAGERSHMRQKGWEMLEFMSSAPAWFSRRLHGSLKHLPGYQKRVEQQAKQRLKTLLDFGCGHGISVLELAEQGFDIVGLDPFSPTHHPRVIRQELLDRHFPDNSFTGIFTIETMEHIPNILAVYRELHRIVQPGGILLVQTRRLEDPDYARDKADWFYLREPATHVSIYSKEAMQKIATMVGFRSVSFRGAKFARFVK